MEGGICTTKKKSIDKSFRGKSIHIAQTFVNVMKFSCCLTALQIIKVDQFNSSEDLTNPVSQV